MNLFGLSPGELILIMLVAMIVIGPEKLPETIASVGKWIREFRRVTQELTQQFADDNPFTEIQRALSFNEDPAPAVEPPAPAPIEVNPADFNVGHPSADVHASGVSANGLIARPSHRTDYFDHPSYYAAIDDSWTHGALNGYRARSTDEALIVPPIDDAWTHGVPDGVPAAATANIVQTTGVSTIDAMDAPTPSTIDDIRPSASNGPASPDSTQPVSVDVANEVAGQSSDLVDGVNAEIKEEIRAVDPLDPDRVPVEPSGRSESNGIVGHQSGHADPHREETPVGSGMGHAEERTS